MKSKIISIRLNLEKLTDRKINDILQLLPSRRKSEYIRNAVIAYDNQEKFIELLKQSMLEILDEREIKDAASKTENTFYDYLKSL